MGSFADCCPKSIDASAGGLVWVRRRNGSWWPGQILGQEEVLENGSASPRAGTPVKLLGRDDTSVDWYNLETTKQVKAFRCGDYDECIEKAKAVATHNSKKVVRHTRREDAILRALELESASLQKDDASFFSKTDKEDGLHMIEGSPSSSHPQEENENRGEDGSNTSEGCSSSDPELSGSGASLEEANTISASEEQSAQGSQHQTLSDSDEGGTEGAKRMRGLDDLGTGVVQSLKRKRSQVAHVREFLKKKSRRRRRLMKVLESTAMVTVPVVCEGLPSPNGSDLAGSCDSSFANCKLKEKASPSFLGLPENGGLESLFDVPFVTEEKHSAGLSPIVSLASLKAQIGSGEKASQSSQVGTMPLVNSELIESGSRSLGNTEIHDISERIGQGTSKWQSKGKRNTRHTRRTKKCDLGKTMCMNDIPLASLEAFTTKGKTKHVAEFQMDKSQGWSRGISPRETHTKGPKAEVLNPQRLLPYRQSRFTVNPKYESSDFSFRHHKADSQLYDVNLEVKSSYGRPQHVPYVSLMGRINGRPITGHPLTVEVLDDGFCAQLLPSASECYSSSYDHLDEDSSALQGIDMFGGTKPSSCTKVHPRGSTTRASKSKKTAQLSKKMRKLSSLTGSRKQSQEKKPLARKLIGPSVACVPLKVVFSRINEALNSSS